MPFWINLTVSMLSLLIAGVSGIFLVPFLHKLKFGQPIKPRTDLSGTQKNRERRPWAVSCLYFPQ